MFKTSLVFLIVPLAGCMTTYGDPIALPYGPNATTGSGDILASCPSSNTHCNESQEDSDGDGFFISIYTAEGAMSGLTHIYATSRLLLSTQSENDLSTNFGNVLKDPTFFADAATGSATFSGSYLVSYSSDIEETQNTSGANIEQTAGAMTLNVDFDGATVSGASTDGRLQVFGTLSDDGSGDMTGQSVWDGSAGDALGIVGDEKAIGAVAGSDDTSFFAGGFTVN